MKNIEDTNNSSIAFFFGSFNPTHIGHLAIADFVVSEFNLKKIFFVISPVSPDKKNSKKELLDLEKRINLLKISLEDNNKFQIDLREAKKQKNNFYTIDSVLEIKKELKLKPAEKIKLILGSDNFFNLYNWHLAEELKKHCKFLVFKRDFSFKEKLKELRNQNFYQELDWQLIEAPVLEISASLIREYKVQKKSYRYFLAEKAYQKYC